MSSAHPPRSSMEEQRWFADNHKKYKLGDRLLLEVQLDHEQWLLIHPLVLTLTKLALNCLSFKKQTGVKWFAHPDINEFSESEVTCGQILWPMLKQWTNTPWTHPEQWAAIFAVAPSEQLGIRCHAEESHLSRGIEGGRECWLFTTKSKWLDN